MYQLERYGAESDAWSVSTGAKLGIFGAACLCQVGMGLLYAREKVPARPGPEQEPGQEHNGGGKPSFNPVFMVFLIELAKLGVSAGQLLISDGLAGCKRFDLCYLVPGGLYMVGDNIYLLVLAYMTPGTLGLLWSIKACRAAAAADLCQQIIWTVLMVRFVLNTKLVAQQWAAIAVLLTSIVVARTSSSEPSDGPAQSSAFGLLTGLALCSVGTLIMTSGNISTEFLLKRSPGLSIYWQNLQLYTCGLLFSSLAVLGQLWASGWQFRNLAAGLGSEAWLIVCFATAGGLLTGAVLKHLDNLVLIYTHVTAMFAISISSWIWFHFTMTWNFVVGLVLASISEYLYFRYRSDVKVAPDGKEMAYFTVADELDDAFGEGGSENLNEDAPFL